MVHAACVGMMIWWPRVLDRAGLQRFPIYLRPPGPSQVAVAAAALALGPSLGHTCLLAVLRALLMPVNQRAPVLWKLACC